jgi:hypothetical protein
MSYTDIEGHELIDAYMMFNCLRNIKLYQLLLSLFGGLKPPALAFLLDPSLSMQQNAPVH